MVEVVTSPPSEVSRPAAERLRPTDPATWPVTWPLSVLILGFPLWWALGLSDMAPLLLAVPMALQLLRMRPVRTPPGFPAWLVFMLCVVASGAMLLVDAPGGVPGGASSRPLVFGYRLAWYLTITIVLLWVANLDRNQLPTRQVMRLIGWLFAITAFGGLLGVFAPNFEFSSLMEIVLPGGLAKNGFLRPLIHPVAASVQTILGDPSPRPTAPFAYSNSWGSNLSITLPFFVAGWMARDGGWRRLVAPVVLLAAVVPVVFSLNRGLWLSLGLGLAFVIARIALSGRPLVLLGTLAVVLIGVVVFIASPLSNLATERVENPHSNDRRGQLLNLTLESAAKGSPVLGFGSTRDVKGSFASIAGGATPECPACRVPPLGTQGQIWLVVFSQGYLGLLAFLAFYLRQWLEYGLTRTTVELVGICALLFFTVQLLVYDMLGLPMYVLMVGIGLMWRERLADGIKTGRGTTLAAIGAGLRRSRTLILSFVVIGSLGGAVMAFTTPPGYVATAPVLLAQAPVHIDLTGETEPNDITIDTEAAMVFSEQSVDSARSQVGMAPNTPVRDRVAVTAPPNTRVLEVTVSGDDPDEAAALADALAASYIDVRGDYLALRRDQVLTELREQLASLSGSDELDTPEVVDPTAEPGDVRPTEENVREAIDALLVMPTAAGKALRPANGKEAKNHPEVPIISGAVLGAVLAFLVIWIRNITTTILEDIRRAPRQRTADDERRPTPSTTARTNA